MTQAADVLACLPAAPREIATVLNLPLHSVYGVLCGLQRNHYVIRTDRYVRHGVKQRGPAKSRLWVRSGKPHAADGADDDTHVDCVSTLDVLRMQRRALLREYKVLKKQCAALHWKQRHAFTAMGLA